MTQTREVRDARGAQARCIAVTMLMLAPLSIAHAERMLSLGEVIALARHNNRDLAAARESLASLRRDRAASCGLFRFRFHG